MADPFRPNTKSQLFKEAQIGLTVVALLLALLVYVAFYRITGRGRHLPEHVRLAPVAEQVWPGGRSEKEIAAMQAEFNGGQLQSQNPAQGLAQGTAYPTNPRIGFPPQNRIANTPGELRNPAFDKPLNRTASSSTSQTRNPKQFNNEFGSPESARAPSSYANLASREAVPQTKTSQPRLPLGNPNFEPFKAPANEAVGGLATRTSPDRPPEPEQKIEMPRLTPPPIISQTDPQTETPARPPNDPFADPVAEKVTDPVGRPVYDPFVAAPATETKPTADAIRLASAEDQVKNPSQTFPIEKPFEKPSQFKPLAPSSDDNGFAPIPQTDLRTNNDLNRPKPSNGNHLIQPNKLEPQSEFHLKQPPSQPAPLNPFAKPKSASSNHSKVRSLLANSMNGSSGNSSAFKVQVEPESPAPSQTFEPLRPAATMTSPKPQRFSNAPKIQGSDFKGPNNFQGTPAVSPSTQASSPKPSTFTTQVTPEPKQKNDPRPVLLPKDRQPSEHVVVVGDSFWSIAQSTYNDGQYFRALYRYNETVVGSSGELVAGTRVQTPTLAQLRSSYPDLCPRTEMSLVGKQTSPLSQRVYETQRGDTLFEIAKQRLGQASRYLEIKKLNSLRLDQSISHLAPLAEGTQLVLPLQ